VLTLNYRIGSSCVSRRGLFDTPTPGGDREACVGASVYGASDVARDKQYVIFPSDRASARVQARRLAMLEFGVRQPTGVDVVETRRFEDRRGAIGWTVLVREA